MPKKRHTDEEGWIHSDQLAMPRQPLMRDRVDDFLNFLFSDLSRRPEELRLLETAKVVRYLRTLAAIGVPNELVSGDDAAIAHYRPQESEESNRSRRLLDRLALQIWSMLLQSGRIEPCRKHVALRFLRRHEQTYLNLSDLGPSLEFIKGLEIPSRAEPVFEPPALMSTTTSRVGDTNPRLRDDLSERIYAAYHALKRENVRRVRPRIAEALSRSRVVRESGRRKTKGGWTWADVNDRIKSFERQFRRQHLPKASDQDARQALARHGQWLANHWLFVFRRSIEEQSGREPNTSNSG